MKKALSIMLVIALVFTMMPMSAFAAANPRIYFETDFSNELGVGDTFTVTAMLEDNEIFSTMTLSLDWNENVVQFNGFDVDRRGSLVTEVYTYSAPVINNATGVVVGADAYGYDTNGMIFTANFEIIAESGELGLGLKTDSATQFEMADLDMNDIPVNLDFSAISGLTVGGKPVGPEMPEDAPFTAITTDAGAIVDVEDCGFLAVDPWGGMPVEVPYYHITIPAEATEAYIRFDQPTSDFMSQTAMDGTPEIGSAWACVNDYESGMAGLLFEDMGDYTNVIIPLEFNGDPWGGEDMKSTVKTSDEDELYYAVGPQDAGANTIAVFSLEFASEDGEEEEIYSITIDENMVGGTLTVVNENGEPITEAAAGDYVFVTITPADGYSGNSYTINGELANDVIFQMPEEDVILSATFTPIHTCEFKEVVHSEYLKNEATCEHGAEYLKSCTCGKISTETFFYGETVDHVYVDGVCKWCGAAEPVIAAGYTVTMPADITVVTGETVNIPVVIGYSGNVGKYNAFDFTFAYDPAVLELTSTKINDMTVEVENGVIHVVRYGTEQALGTALTLTFNALATGEADVKLTSAKVDISASALGSDAPDATIIDDTTAVKVTGYTATLPEEFNGSETVIPGADYTFSANDLNYDYVVTATINGEEVKVIDNGDGTYTIQAEDITGDIVITMTKTGKKFDVTLGEDMDGAEEAQYMTDYEATLTKEAGYGYKITVTIGGTEYTGFIYNEETGILTIPGKDITGEVVIDSGKEAGEFSVTFEGNGAGDAEGDAVAEGGKSYSFTLNMADGYDYTVTATMDGEAVELSESESIYTIEKVTGNIVITIEKTSDLEVEVKEYVTLNDKTVFLVTATQTLAEDEALSYDGTVMFWSEQYKAWAFLVITEDTLSAEDAKTLITNGKAEYTTLTQTLDVNGTNKVDINDAQLVFDLYNNVYQDFTVATMVKFLKADVNGDKNIDVSDASAVVAEIMK